MDETQKQASQSTTSTVSWTQPLSDFVGWVANGYTDTKNGAYTVAKDAYNTTVGALYEGISRAAERSC